MERKDFIEQVGLSAASILIFGCMQSCSKSDTAAPSPSPNPGGSGNTGTTKVDFTININNAPYNNLLNKGGFYIDRTTSIIIARTLSDSFVAVSSVCTHQQVTIDFEPNNNRFYCSGHGSVFTLTGAVSNGPATVPLKQYKTTLSGTNLRIYE